MAAGLKIEAEKVDAFRDAFAARAAQLLTSRDMLSKLTIDDQVSLAQLDEPLVHDLSRLEPFGAGNPAPLLATNELEIIGEPRTVGGKGTHLQVTLAEGRRQFKAIAFGQAALKPTLLDHRRCRVAFRPIINEWNGDEQSKCRSWTFSSPRHDPNSFYRSSRCIEGLAALRSHRRVPHSYRCPPHRRARHHRRRPRLV